MGHQLGRRTSKSWARWGKSKRWMIWCSMMWCWVFSMTTTGYINGIQSSKNRWNCSTLLLIFGWRGKSLLNSKFACKTLHFFLESSKTCDQMYFIHFQFMATNSHLVRKSVALLPFSTSGLSLVWDLGSRCFVPLDPWGGLFFQGVTIPSRKWTHIPPIGRGTYHSGFFSDLLTNRIC